MAGGGGGGGVSVDAARAWTKDAGLVLRCSVQ